MGAGLAVREVSPLRSGSRPGRLPRARAEGAWSSPAEAEELSALATIPRLLRRRYRYRCSSQPPRRRSESGRVVAPAQPAPHKDFFPDLYEKMSGKGASASETHLLLIVSLLQDVVLDRRKDKREASQRYDDHDDACAEMYM